MAYDLTVDERYGGGIYQYSAGYYDAPNTLNETYVISQDGIAYGTNDDIYLTADIDTYSLGILSPGEYIVNVDDYTWDILNLDIGSVYKFEVLDSFGYIVASSYSTYSDINFNVNLSSTFYINYWSKFWRVTIQLIYSKIETNSPTIFDVPTYSNK